MPHEPGHELTIGELYANGGDPIEAAMARAFEEAKANQKPDDPLIGGFSEDAQVITPGPGKAGPPAPVKPVFRLSDLEKIVTWPPEKRSRLVLRMMQSGLIDEQSDPRFWTSKMTEELEKSLLFANSNGIFDPFEAVATFGAQDAASKSLGKEFQPPTELKPDYASLAQDVKTLMKQRLGRDREPNEYELQQLTGELSGFYADQYEAETELARIQFEQANNPEAAPANPAVTNVDPLARFQEMFDQKYAGAISTVKARDRTAEEAPRVASIIESGLA